MPPNAADISLNQIDAYDTEFWAGRRDAREATFQLHRDTPELQHFEERVIEDSPFAPGNFINGIKRLDCACACA